MPVEYRIVENKIPALMVRVEAVARAAVKEVADKIATSAQEYVPVDTSALHDTIRSVSTGAGKEAEVTAGDDTVDYAAYVEFGTYKMAAQPYLSPAVDDHRDALPEAILVAFEI